MTLLERIGRGLEAIESGAAVPPSDEYLRECQMVLTAAGELTPVEVDEMREDLVAYFLRYQDLGRSPADAVRDWAAEWGLDDQ